MTQAMRSVLHLGLFATAAALSPGCSDDGGDHPRTLAQVAAFDATQGQLAEGLAIRGDAAYVGFGPLGKVVKVELSGGAVSEFAATPPIPIDGANSAGFLLGLAFDRAGNLYGAVASFDASFAGGIYKWSAAGGAVAGPWATSAAFGFPNGLAFDAAGTLFVADSSGKILAVDPATAAVTEWSADPLLAGAKSNCANAVSQFDIGANGIVIDGSTVYVANSNQATIVEIPIRSDGSAGDARMLAGPDCEALGGIDGIALSGGQLLAALNNLDTLSAIATSDGAIEQIASGAPLQSPASVSFGGPNEYLYVTNAAFKPEQQPGLFALE